MRRLTGRRVAAIRSPARIGRLEFVSLYVSFLSSDGLWRLT